MATVAVAEIICGRQSELSFFGVAEIKGSADVRGAKRYDFEGTVIYRPNGSEPEVFGNVRVSYIDYFNEIEPPRRDMYFAVLARQLRTYGTHGYGEGVKELNI